MSLLLYSERAGARAGYKGVVKRCRLLIFYEIKTPIVFDRFKTQIKDYFSKNKRFSYIYYTTENKICT